MATLSVTYLDDIGRVRIELIDGLPGVRYQVQRSTADDPVWVNVRGGGFLSTTQTTILDDYEYTPNIANFYRLIAPAFYDSFDRAFPSAGTLSLTGVDDSYASTPDNAALDITGDIDIRVDATTTWSGEQRGLVAKWVLGTDQRSYLLTIESNGRLRLFRSTSGTAATQTAIQSTVAVPITSGRLAVRVTLDVNNGAGGHTVTFYTSAAANVNGPWVQLGSPVIVAGTITNFSGTAPLEVGSWDLGTNGEFDGQIHYAQVRNGIAGAIVANPAFASQPAGTTNFVDSAGRTWTVHAEADIITIAPVPGSSWGTANTGQTWSLGGSSAGFYAYANNGVGVYGSVSPSGETEQFTSPVPGLEDGEITWSAIYPDPANLLDVNVDWTVGLRAADSSNAYESHLEFLTEDDDYGVAIRIYRLQANARTLIGDGGVVGSWVTGIPWHVRFRVQGSTLSARAWQEGSAEPMNWQVVSVDTNLVAGNRVYARGFKASGLAYEQWFGPMEAHTIPASIADTVTITPLQDDVWLKSLAYPMLNRVLDCVDWEELERSSRTSFFDIKGRHEILGIADVGSTASFTLTFISRSRAENLAIVALLTYGGLMLLQPPGDDESEGCPIAYSGIPDGYVMSGDYVQSRTVYGKPQWLWTVSFTQVAPADGDAIVPTTITWTQLWQIIGPEGTWEDVWALWSTWQEIWLTLGNPITFGDLT
jgi:hypothetical protein